MTFPTLNRHHWIALAFSLRLHWDHLPIQIKFVVAFFRRAQTFKCHTANSSTFPFPHFYVPFTFFIYTLQPPFRVHVLIIEQIGYISYAFSVWRSSYSTSQQCQAKCSKFKQASNSSAHQTYLIMKMHLTIYISFAFWKNTLLDSEIKPSFTFFFTLLVHGQMVHEFNSFCNHFCCKH